MRTVANIFAWFLVAVCFIGLWRIALAWRQGKRRTALYWVYQTLVLLWGLVTFVWLILLHWTRWSYPYFTLACMVPVYCHKPLADMRASIPDGE